MSQPTENKSLSNPPLAGPAEIEALLEAQWQTLLSPKEVFAELEMSQQTPLENLPDLAESLGINSLFVKDERERLNLGSFKGIGGIYAVTCILQALIQQYFKSPVTMAQLLSTEARHYTESVRFCCASAGNHGIAVSKGAGLFGAKSIVYLSKNVPMEFEQRLLGYGAEVRRAGSDYQQSMAAAEQASKNEQLILLSDSSWSGYRCIPQLIMTGYQLIAREIQQSLELLSTAHKETNWPTHVFLQAGVGGLAMGITKEISCSWPVQPKIIIVEPDQAPCLATSIQQGVLTSVSGGVSNMGRLDCKQASLLAYEYLLKHADYFCLVSDQEAADAVWVLRDYQLDTTPSGAAGFSGIQSITKKQLLHSFSIEEDARCLFIVTEEPSNQ